MNKTIYRIDSDIVIPWFIIKETDLVYIAKSNATGQEDIIMKNSDNIFFSEKEAYQAIYQQIIDYRESLYKERDLLNNKINKIGSDLDRIRGKCF